MSESVTYRTGPAISREACAALRREITRFRDLILPVPPLKDAPHAVTVSLGHDVFSYWPQYGWESYERGKIDPTSFAHAALTEILRLRTGGSHA